MSCILHIETSTKVCSVAVTEDGAVLFEKVDKSGPSHAVQLGVFVDEAISYIDNHGIPFDAVAVSQGPGSSTGLRIGVSMAKGICYGRNIPLKEQWEELPPHFISSSENKTGRQEILDYIEQVNRSLKEQAE